MGPKSQYAKAFTAIIAFALFASGCTKSREAALPDGMQEAVFAISEFGDLQTENSQFKVQTDDSLSELSIGDSAKATAEKGLVSIDDAEVPGRLKYMFLGLEITGQANKEYPLTFSVDKQFVTAYKVVTDPSELTILEKQLSQVKEEVVIQKQLQKTKDIKASKALLASLKQARANKSKVLSQKSAVILVPLFKFKIQSYGTLQRAKNDLKEETSTLQLKPSEWTEATHIQISTNSVDRMPVGLDPASKGEMDRTFVMDRINNKIMTAGTLASEYQISLNLNKDARVLTLLDVDALHVYEINSLKKLNLTDSQLRQLKAGTNKGSIRKCPPDIIAALPADAQKECILVLRYDVPVNYVSPELPIVDNDGNQAASVQFKPVRSSDNIGLVQIGQNVEPKKIVSNNELDPKTTIRIADIKGKEFFFKRTIEEASLSAGDTGLTPGMAGVLTIVRFEFEEKRVVLRKVDKIVKLKDGAAPIDNEEVMSLPVVYKKLDTKDASGAALSVPRLTNADRTDAQYIEIDWTGNTIPQEYSPYSSFYEGCVLGTADTEVADVDMRLTKGVLNFSQKYALAIKASCLVHYSSSSSFYDLNNPGYEYTARVSERISLKLNDGSSDKPFVQEIPFPVQNALSFGVWTTSHLKENALLGGFGREGSENNHPMVHDFRNGKKLVYTLTGLPNDNPEDRELYIGIARELVGSWNAAYKQAFHGSAMARDGNYIELEINGENGVQAHLGDLDKNIFHIEVKPSNSGVLGVSQVGYNPRSAIVVADSLILYGGNVKADVANSFRQAQIRKIWDDIKTKMREETLAEMKKRNAADEKAKNGEKLPAKAPVEDKAAVAQAVSRQILNMSKGNTLAPNLMALAQNLKLQAPELKEAIKKGRSNEAFAYAPSKANYGWMDKVLRVVTSKPDISISEIQGVMAKEILAAKGDRLTDSQKASLNNMVKTSEMRTRLMSSMKMTPGCVRSEADVANSNFGKLSFNEAFRVEALNTMVHEMGHSQGLTHNFIGSYDQANYANEDGTPSKRNYSSVMDYLTPGKFSWDGLGSYDIRAIRASHLGLFEVTEDAKAKLGGDFSLLVNEKYVKLETIKTRFTENNSWVGFSSRNVKDLLKPYKYCNDLDAGDDPACQRHDFGSSAVEIVTSIIEDIENNYVTNYTGWDRLTFDDSNSWIGSAYTSYYLFLMRKYMDETFYKAYLGKGTQEEISDYANAAIIAYQYYIQLIRTPDAGNEGFLSSKRLMALEYERDELDKNDKPTGKKVRDITIVEKRSLLDLMTDDKRTDSAGIEYDKIAALEMLTMRGFPAARYYKNSLRFSYMDFEKLVLRMGPTQSPVANTIASMLTDHLIPTYSNEYVGLQPMRDEKADVTSAMTAYAAIYSILNLEQPTLVGAGYSNLYKVASSIGQGPDDRPVVSALTSAANSKARVGFWALDNATVSKGIVALAAKKNIYIQKSPELAPLMDALVVAVFKSELDMSLSEEHKPTPALEAKVKQAKAALLAKLEQLNAKNELVTQAEITQNMGLALPIQVDSITRMIEQTVQVALPMVTGEALQPGLADDLKASTEMVAKEFPLCSIAQTVMQKALEREGTALAAGGPEVKAYAGLGDVVQDLVTVNALETSYNTIIRNIDFLSQITLMTNPEYDR